MDFGSPAAETPRVWQPCSDQRTVAEASRTMVASNGNDGSAVSVWHRTLCTTGMTTAMRSVARERVGNPPAGRAGCASGPGDGAGAQRPRQRGVRYDLWMNAA